MMWFTKSVKVLLLLIYIGHKDYIAEACDETFRNTLLTDLKSFFMENEVSKNCRKECLVLAKSLFSGDMLIFFYLLVFFNLI